MRGTHTTHTLDDWFAPRWTWRAVLWAAAVTLGLFALLPGLERLSEPPAMTLSVRPVSTSLMTPPLHPPTPTPERAEPVQPPARPASPVPEMESARRQHAPLPFEMRLAPDLDRLAGDFKVKVALADALPIRQGGERVLVIADLDSPPRPVARREPLYPPGARSRGVEGSVTTAFTVTAEGLVRDIEILASDPPGIFDRAATDAIARWRFTPGRKNSAPVAVRVEQKLSFRLE